MAWARGVCQTPFCYAGPQHNSGDRRPLDFGRPPLSPTGTGLELGGALERFGMPETLPGKSIPHVPRGGLFRKYVALFIAVVCAALASKALLDAWFSFQEQKELLGRIQHEQAKTAALRIGLFLKGLESQLGWATQFPWR